MDIRAGVGDLESLNAPYGARCFLTKVLGDGIRQIAAGLNAPYGARCFLTERIPAVTASVTAGLNAPYGARCFLTRRHCAHRRRAFRVLMHLMALGAF